MRYLDEEKRSRDFTEIIAGFVIGVCVCVIALLIVFKPFIPTVEANAEEVEIMTENANVYVICDVIAVDLENGTFDAEMQNGEIHTYSADDLPLEFSLVCFKTNNLDDFTTYEVVALR